MWRHETKEIRGETTKVEEIVVKGKKLNIYNVGCHNVWFSENFVWNGLDVFYHVSYGENLDQTTD